MTQIGGWFDEDVDIRGILAIFDDSVDDPDSKAAGINLVSAASDDSFARLHPLIGKHVDDLGLSHGVSTQDAAEPCRLEQNTCSAGLVGNDQNLRSVPKDVFQLADDAVWRNHGHVWLEAVFAPFVYIENARLIGARGTDHLGRDRVRNVLLFKRKQRLQPLPLAGVFKQARLFQLEAAHLFAQVLVLLAHVAQVEIIGPQATHTRTGTMQDFLRWRHQADGPIADQPDGGRIRGSGIGPPDLHSQSNDLEDQNTHQKQYVFIAAQSESMAASTCQAEAMLSALRTL